MNLQKLRDELIIDEGIRYKIYFDSKGKPSMGIGHLITPKDPEHALLKDWTPRKVVRISKERVEELFKKDIEICLESCRNIFDNFDRMLEELQLILANMMFNLGQTKFEGFRKFIIFVKAADYIGAAEEMRDSLWSRQLSARVNKLADRMIKLSKLIINKEECEHVIAEKSSKRV